MNKSNLKDHSAKKDSLFKDWAPQKQYAIPRKISRQIPKKKDTERKFWYPCAVEIMKPWFYLRQNCSFCRPYQDIT